MPLLLLHLYDIFPACGDSDLDGYLFPVRAAVTLLLTYPNVGH